MDLSEILKAKKMSGLSWDQLAENLPINGGSLRMAFKRKSVDSAYLKSICDKLNIDFSTIDTKYTSEMSRKSGHNESYQVDYKELYEDMKFISENQRELIAGLKKDKDDLLKQVEILTSRLKKDAG